MADIALLALVVAGAYGWYTLGRHLRAPRVPPEAWKRTGDTRSDLRQVMLDYDGCRINHAEAWRRLDALNAELDSR